MLKQTYSYQRKIVELVLRECTIEDRDLLFEWANDPETRNSSFTTGKIAYVDHCKWFDRILADDKEHPYIVLDENEPVGQVRLTISGDVAEINYSVAPEKRGMGYGSVIISLIKKKTFEGFPNVKKLVAKVKPKNIASIYCFENNRFEEKYKQYEYDMMEYKSDERDYT